MLRRISGRRAIVRLPIILKSTIVVHATMIVGVVVWRVAVLVLSQVTGMERFREIGRSGARRRFAL
jgi:hypothetical protein